MFSTFPLSLLFPSPPLLLLSFAQVGSTSESMLPAPIKHHITRMLEEPTVSKIMAVLTSKTIYHFAFVKLATSW